VAFVTAEYATVKTAHPAAMPVSRYGPPFSLPQVMRL